MSVGFGGRGDIKSWQKIVETWISIWPVLDQFFVIRLRPDANTNLTKLIYIRTQVNYGQLRNSTSWNNRSRRNLESQLDPCHEDTNWNKQPIVAFEGQIGYKSRRNNAGLFIDYTFLTPPVPLQSIGKCIMFYALRRFFSNWGPRNATGPQYFFPPYYKLWPVPVAARPKAWVCGRSLAEIVGSNPTGGMDICMLWVLCVVR